jgi:hypothetical protein
MLYIEKTHNYIVYPTWAEFSYRWEDLPRLLSDPMKSGYLPPGRDPQYFLDFGYTMPPQPFTLVDGPEGGGIIMWKGDPHEGRGWRWLPIVVLTSEADLRRPIGMDGLREKFDAQVVAMEPHGGGFRRPNLYTCPVTTEHAYEARNDTYWMICSRTEESRIKGLNAIQNWAKTFGLAGTRLIEIPSSLLGQVDRWIPDPKYRRIWYRIDGGGDDVGFHFAVLVYVAYHLRWLARRHIVSMHLISRIEGEPNSLPTWNWEAIR